MHASLVHTLKHVNDAFYRENAASFSRTRDHAWLGWRRVLASLDADPGRVVDVACGNARFKAFLDESGVPAEYRGVDSCAALLPGGMKVAFQELDIIEAAEDGSLACSIGVRSFDLVACFGLMHHVPSRELRERLVAALVQVAKPGGFVALSFWQFALVAAERQKAEDSTARACDELGIEPAGLDAGDYILGWNGKPRTWRYCHSFADSELDDVVARCAGEAVLVDRFRADGRTGAMNGYLVLQRVSV